MFAYVVALRHSAAVSSGEAEHNALELPSQAAMSRVEASFALKRPGHKLLVETIELEG